MHVQSDIHESKEDSRKVKMLKISIFCHTDFKWMFDHKKRLKKTFLLKKFKDFWLFEQWTSVGKSMIFDTKIQIGFMWSQNWIAATIRRASLSINTESFFCSSLLKLYILRSISSSSVSIMMRPYWYSSIKGGTTSTAR